MLTITLATMKSDIAGKMKGTSIREIKDFYGTARSAADRMLGRIDTEETRRTVTMTTPFYDNLNDYALVTDYKGMIDIRPQANRTSQPGLSHYEQTAARQFNERLTPDSFSIRWNNMTRTLRAQVLPQGNVMVMDSFDSATANGSWAAEGDASGLYTEELNYVEGSASLGMVLSGVTGAADIVNSTATAVDLSLQRNEDASMMFVYIPSGYSSRFTSFTLRRGDSATAYISQTVTTKADGTAFTDGWNLLLFSWSTGTTTGSPGNTLNTYRRFSTAYSIGTAITGLLVDNWTNALGTLYEIEYYSEFLFRSSTGTWLAQPTADTDLVNVSPLSYEILLAEMMVDVTKQIRIGPVQAQELADWRKMLNGDPQSRYIKDPPYHGLYADYLKQYPSSRIVTATRTYDFDV